MSSIFYTVLLLFQSDFLPIGFKALKKLKSVLKLRLSWDKSSRIINQAGKSSNHIRNKVQNFNEDTEISFPFSDIWQIVIFHIQDVGLFHTDVMNSSIQGPLSAISSKISGVFRISLIFTQNICLTKINVIQKSFFQLSIVPIIIFNFIIIILILKVVSIYKVNFSLTMWYVRILTGTLLLILFANQMISSTLLRLIECVSIGEKRHLSIYAETECWQLWQIAIIIYVVFFTIAQCFVFLFGPGLLNHKMIRTWQFMAALIIPTPFLSYWVYLIIKYKYNRISPCKSDTAQDQSQLATCILDEVHGSFNTEKTPYFISWSGFIELWRLALVIYSIFISHPVFKIFIMTLTVFIVLVGNISMLPFSNPSINIFTCVSISAQVLVGFINFGFAVIALIEAEIPEFSEFTILVLVYIEEVCALWLPIGIIIVNVLHHTVQISHQKRV